METTEMIVRTEIWHRDHNLDNRDNLGELPEERAVFGIFGIVDEEPVNCRYVAEADNLREAIRRLFEQPPGEGMRKFMQGPWIQLLVYESMPDSSGEDRQRATEKWVQEYKPMISESGEYPGYYE